MYIYIYVIYISFKLLKTCVSTWVCLEIHDSYPKKIKCLIMMFQLSDGHLDMVVPSGYPFGGIQHGQLAINHPPVITILGISTSLPFRVMGVFMTLLHPHYSTSLDVS